jgi:hypothetical protein
MSPRKVRLLACSDTIVHGTVMDLPLARASNNYKTTSEAVALRNSRKMVIMLGTSASWKTHTRTEEVDPCLVLG